MAMPAPSLVIGIDVSKAELNIARSGTTDIITSATTAADPPLAEHPCPMPPASRSRPPIPIT